MNLSRRALMKGLLSCAALAPLARHAKAEPAPSVPPSKETYFDFGDYKRTRAAKDKALFESMADHFEREMWSIPKFIDEADL